MATRYQMPAAEVLRRAFERVSDADLARSASQATSGSTLADGPTASMPARSASIPETRSQGAQPGHTPVRERSKMTYAALLARIQERQRATSKNTDPCVGT